MDRDSLLSKETESHRFSNREIEYLLNLIADYTNKLRVVSDRIRRLRRRTQALYVCASVVLIVVSGIGFWYIFQEFDFRRITLMIPIGTSLMAIFFGYLWYRSIRTLDSRTSGELRVLHIQFEEVVLLASQIEDQGDVSLMHKFALRLVLAEAEGALRNSLGRY